jgi:alpha-glucosidase
MNAQKLAQKGVLMFKNKVFVALFITILAGWSCRPGENSKAQLFSVSSPDGNISIEFKLKSNPQPYLPGLRAYYKVTYKDKTILTDSPLGLDFQGSRPLDRDFEIVETKSRSHDQTWENLFGAKRVIPDNYNQLTVSLREQKEPGRRVDLLFRAYNEGAALRYYLPEQEALETFTLASENTGFYFAGSPSAFALNMGRFTTHYEGEYTQISLEDIKPVSIINLPLLIEIPAGPWVALLEADLKDYAGMQPAAISNLWILLPCHREPGPINWLCLLFMKARWSCWLIIRKHTRVSPASSL